MQAHSSFLAGMMLCIIIFVLFSTVPVDRCSDLQRELVQVKAELARVQQRQSTAGAIEVEGGAVKAELTPEDVTICRDKQAELFRQEWNTTEFYSDAPLEQFWNSFDRKWPNPCGTGQAAVIDIGTHVGDQVEYWGRNFGKSRGCSNTHFFLFEPNPATHAELLHNLKRFHTGDDWSPQRMAVSNYSGTATFYYNRGPRANKAKNQMASLGKVRGEDAAAGGGVSVKVLTLDEFLEARKIDSVPMLKIDTEGFDATVLFGAERTLRKTEHIVYECHKLWQTGSGDTLGAVVPWLERRGFVSFKVGHPHCLRMYGGYWHPVFDQLLQWQNCVAVRPQSPAFHLLSTLC
eukprot:EG_transcript_12214